MPAKRKLINTKMTFEQALDNEKKRDQELGLQLFIVVCTADSPDAFEQVLADEEEQGQGESTRDFFESRVGAFLFRQAGGADESRFARTRQMINPYSGRREPVIDHFDELYPIERRLLAGNARNRYFLQIFNPNQPSSPCLLGCLGYETAEQVTEKCVPDLQVTPLPLSSTHEDDATPPLSPLLYTVIIYPSSLPQAKLDQPLVGSTPLVSLPQHHDAAATSDSSHRQLRQQDRDKFIYGPRMREKVL
jgi:hypothetical protein